MTLKKTGKKHARIWLHGATLLNEFTELERWLYSYHVLGQWRIPLLTIYTKLGETG